MSVEYCNLRLALTLIGMSSESKKNVLRLNELCPIDANSYFQKCLKFFYKNLADKILSKYDKEIKVSPLMPVRVNSESELLKIKAFCTTIQILQVP